MSSSLRKPWISVCILLGISLLPRLLLVLIPPRAFLYTGFTDAYPSVDEVQILISALDRFLGIPSTCTMWPATPLQMLTLPFWLLGALFHSGIPHGVQPLLEKLTAALAQSIGSPQSALTLMRCINALGASFAPILGFVLARRLGRSLLFAWLAATAILLMPAFFQQSIIASGEGLLVPFLLAGLTLLVPFLVEDDRPQEPHLIRFCAAGLCLAGAIASKFTAAPLVVLYLVFLLAPANPALSVKRALAFFTSIGIGLLAFVPWLWTDPIRLAKGVGGNLSKHGSYASLPLWLQLHRQAYGLPGCFLLAGILLFGGVALLVSKGKIRLWLLSSWCALLLLNWPLYRNATVAFPRYLVPEILPFFCLAMGAALALHASVSLPRYRILACAMLLCLACSTVVLCLEVVHARTGDDGFEEALAMRDRMQGAATLYLPVETVLLHSNLLPSEWLAHAQLASERIYREHTGIHLWLQNHGFPERLEDPLLMNFTEMEQAHAAHLRLLQPYAQARPWKIYLYRVGTPQDAEVTLRNAWMDGNEHQALAQWRTHPSDALLYPCALTSLTPRLRVRNWCWYQDAPGQR